MVTGIKKSRKKASGCLIFIVIYSLCLAAIFITSKNPEETKNFSGSLAKDFYVAAIVKKEPGQVPEYKAFNLEYLNTGKVDLSATSFLLPEKKITINVGDIHQAEILEDHGEWQLVAFHYSNTHTSTSKYRAYENHIEPVSYKLTSHVGQFISAIALFVPALILSVIISTIINWRAARAARD